MEKLENKKIIVMLCDDKSVNPIGIIPNYESRKEFISKYFGINNITTKELGEGFNVVSVINNFFAEEIDEEREINKIEQVSGVEEFKNTINGKVKRTSVNYVLAYKSVEEYM